MKNKERSTQIRDSRIRSTIFIFIVLWSSILFIYCCVVYHEKANMVIELKANDVRTTIAWSLKKLSPPLYCIVTGGFLLMKVLFHSGTTYLHTTNNIGKRSNVKMHYRCSRKVKTTDLSTPLKTFSAYNTTYYYTLWTLRNGRERGDYITLCLSV